MSKNNLLHYFFWHGVAAEIDDFKRSLKVTVLSSIRACPDTEHAARAAEDMIEVAFRQFRGGKAKAR